MIHLSKKKSEQTPMISEFYALSEDNQIIRNCYESWKRKHLTLEQALTLAVTKLATACDNFAKQFPTESLTFGGVYFDYTKYVVNNLEYSPSVKMQYLAKHYKALFDLLVTYTTYSPKISIKTSDLNISDDLMKSLRDKSQG